MGRYEDEFRRSLADPAGFWAEAATADLVIVGRKVNNVPVDRVTQQGDFITIDSDAFGMTYEGRIKNNEIQGQLLQGPIETALVLRRPK